MSGTPERASAAKIRERMRKRELAIVAAPERSGPRIEDLQRLDARLDLRLQVVRDRVGEQGAETVPRGRLRIHERFRPRVGCRGSALDRVGRQRERRAAESDQRNAPLQFRAKDPDGLEDVGERLPRLEARQPVHVLGGADRVVDRRPFTLHEIEVQPHRRERDEQIGEENRGVHVDEVHRLQRDGHGQFRVGTDLEEGIALAQRAIVRHVAARLAHEPDRRLVDRLPPAGAQKPIVHTATRVLASAIRSSSQRGLKRMDAPSDFSSC